MQFLSDVFVKCPSCDGRRYRSHVLEVRIARPDSANASASNGAPIAMGVGDILEATAEEAVQFLERFPESRHARAAAKRLAILPRAGLGYLKLGQPINTLSGGECQRLKLAAHLAEFAESKRSSAKRTLFLFDEPTTGLHFEDIRTLMAVFQNLVDEGHSVIVVEHNMDVIRQADWIVDLGPESGEAGGRIVAEGPPREIARLPKNHTGRALREALRPKARRKRARAQTNSNSRLSIA